MNGLRLCAACDSPSPGPLKRLYYQQRPFGPFFPVLEERKKLENKNLYTEGRATVCTSCASHLQRQWASYEKKWTPVERRFYKLRSEENQQQKATENRHASTTPNDELDHTPPSKTWKRAAKNVNRRANAVNRFHHDLAGSPGPSGRGSIASGASDEHTPFQRAVQKVAKQNRVQTESEGLLRLQAVIEEARHQGMARNGMERIRDRPDGGLASDMETRHSKASLLWKLPREVIRLHVRDEMEESIEIMIRKLAEIQHLENVRRTEHALKEAADQMTKARDREKDIGRMVQELKTRFREELKFRDTGRVLNEDKYNPRDGEVHVAAPLEGGAHGGIAGVTAAKKAGKNWKTKAGKSKNDKSLVPSVSTLERIPETESQSVVESERERRKQEAQQTQRELQTVKQELAKEKEWRKKTEGIITKQRSMIDELREGIHDEIERLVEEQTKRHEELKESIAAQRGRNGKETPRPSPPEDSYISLEGGAASRDRKSRDRRQQKREEENTRSRDERKRWREEHDDRSEDDDDEEEDDDDEDEDVTADDDDDDDDHDDDHDDDRDDDRDDRSTRPGTPAYYIQ